MKIFGVLLITFILGFVAFQNCYQVPHPDDLSTSGSVGGAGTENSIDLQGQKISDISFVFQENETVDRNSGSYTMLVNKNLKVSLPSGQMFLTSDLDNAGKPYCLTETLTNELITILKSSKVCKQPAPGPGQVCTQVMRLPYAILVTEKETYSLGAATDGCGSNSIDLCGESATVLQGFYASVKASYKSFVCP